MPKSKLNKASNFAIKYSESMMRQVLAKHLHHPLAEHETMGNIKAPVGYLTPCALVLDLASDNPREALIQSIEQALLELKSRYKSENMQQFLAGKKILLPVAEACSFFFGFFRRKHWVTLCYEPENNCATLIDSRPWYVSFFYPKKAMQQLLRKGIANLFEENLAQTMKFITRYQGVQHNDIFCGAWTAQNILDLATKHKTITEQLKSYTATNEQEIAQKYCSANQQIVLQKLNWLARLLVNLGLMTAKYAISSATSNEGTSAPINSAEFRPQTSNNNILSAEKLTPGDIRKGLKFYDQAVIGHPDVVKEGVSETFNFS